MKNGDNTYYLNKKKTQRSHILDLLDMANAGLGQLNAVQQGTVTRISEFTSEEKRKTIEDLIGLSYFDEKNLNLLSNLMKQIDDLKLHLQKWVKLRNELMNLKKKEIKNYVMIF